MSSSRKVLLRPDPSLKRQPFLDENQSFRTAGTRLGEAVGGTAAICCCAPCGIANIMYLAIYKVPASLCYRAIKRKRRRRQLQGKIDGRPPLRRCNCGCCDDISMRVHPMCSSDDDMVYMKSRSLMEEEDKEVMELEKEMWDRFYGTGFWRSPSQKDSPPLSSSEPKIITTTFSAPNLQVLSASST